MKGFKILLVLLPGFFLLGCKKNEPIKPSPPHTKIFVDKINLSGALRLGTTVQVHWTGYTSAGYITGFEVSLDNTAWHFTKSTDSTFLFGLTNGHDSANINLYVRAIDNYGQRDPKPAKLVIPIKNSPPTVLFDKSKTLPDSVWSVFSLDWTAHDPDGDSTIDSVFIRINNGNWYALNPAVSFVTIYPANVSTPGSTNASVYKNQTPVLLSNQINGLIMNGLNKLYIRAKDNAGAYSAVDSTGMFYLKAKTSDLLLINANSSLDPKTDLLRTVVSGIYGKYDYINYIEGNQKYEPNYWTPTLDFQLKLYNKVFIYTDGLASNGKLVLEYAAAALSDYLNSGGKLIVSVPLPIGLDPSSGIFNFSPADSISTSGGQARFYMDSLAVPDAANAAGYEPLENSTFILGCEPVYLKQNGLPMYTANITRIYNWSGPNTICAKTVNAKGQTNQVFSSVDLSLLNGNTTALTDFFNKVLLHEFNW